MPESVLTQTMPLLLAGGACFAGAAAGVAAVLAAGAEAGAAA